MKSFINCPGSFRTTSTDVAGAEYKRVDGVLKIKVPCFACGKLVGLRRTVSGSRGILAQHQEPKEGTVHTPIGHQQNQEGMLKEAGFQKATNYIAQQAQSKMVELSRRAAALGADLGPFDTITFPGSEQEQQAKMQLACSTSGLFFWKGDADKVFHMKVSDIIGAFLSAYGKHKLAADAFVATRPEALAALGDLAITFAPEHNKTHTAQVVKLALDGPKVGGLGRAADYEIQKHAHPMKPGESLYRAYKRVLGGVEDIGLTSPDMEALKRRVVGLYVVREFILPEASHA